MYTTAVICLAVAVWTVQAQIPEEFLLKCRSCNNARDLGGCDRQVWCDKRSQECYMDKLVTDTATTIYRGGCRTIQNCNGGGASVIGKRTELVACSQCCVVEDDCNSKLCGIARQSTALMCMSCDGKDGRPHPPQFPRDCAYLRICDTNEVCAAKTSAIKLTGEDKYSQLRHYTSCIPTRICSELLRNINSSYVADSSVGKRAEDVICAICSGRELFNHYACNCMKTYIIDLIRHNKFNWTSMDEIRTPIGETDTHVGAWDATCVAH